jgi:hypothetical protein
VVDVLRFLGASRVRRRRCFGVRLCGRADRVLRGRTSFPRPRHQGIASDAPHALVSPAIGGEITQIYSVSNIALPCHHARHRNPAIDGSTSPSRPIILVTTIEKAVADSAFREEVYRVRHAVHSPARTLALASAVSGLSTWLANQQPTFDEILTSLEATKRATRVGCLWALPS